jgi:hypothetical protein
MLLLDRESSKLDVVSAVVIDWRPINSQEPVHLQRYALKRNKVIGIKFSPIIHIKINFKNVKEINKANKHYQLYILLDFHPGEIT